MLRVLFFVLVAAALASVPRVRAEGKPGREQLRALQEVVQQAIDAAERSIACVLVSRSDRYREFQAAPSASQPWRLGTFDARPIIERPFEREERKELARRLDLSDPDTVPEAYGSGVVIDPSGLVLTNFHVIRDATKVFVRLPGRKGSYANVQAGDARSDLAVLKLITPPRDLKALPLGQGGKVRKGEWVLSLANPFAVGFRDGSPSASWGIVSNVRRRAPGGTREEERTKTLHHYGTLIQTDARLNLGSSGGALLNMDGELIGLTTATAALVGGETAGGFAVPMDANMRRVVEVLKRGEEVEYGFLGVSVAPTDAANGRGVTVRYVTPGSPAARAGLKRDDVILSVDDHPVREYDDLFLYIGARLAGSEAVLQVQSPGGRVRKLHARLAKFYYPGPSVASHRPAPAHGIRVDWTSVLMQNPRTQEIPAGVLVREVEPSTPAASRLKPPADGGRILILRVNGRPVNTPEEFYREAGVEGPIELQIADTTRPGETTRTVKVP